LFDDCHFYTLWSKEDFSTKYMYKSLKKEWYFFHELKLVLQNYNRDKFPYQAL
jgi:hypothetical protein